VEEKRLIPVTQWNRFHVWPTVAGLRFYIFNADFNDFDKVVKRVGRRCLIDEAAFFQWVNERSKQNGSK
jgi:hypothetical protein